METKTLIFSLSFLSIMVACSGTSSTQPIPIASDQNPTPVVNVDAGVMDAGQEEASSSMDAAPTCTPESDSVFCNSFGKTCSDTTQLDNCGALRTATCGTCDAGSVCTNGTCAVIPNNCIPETDASFCTQYAKNCGSLTNPDNCGMTRTVANCGACIAPMTCASGTCSAAVCVPEADLTFCSRYGKNCGALTNLDNCGASRVVASCGAACVAPLTCTNNACSNPACVPETDVNFCSRNVKNCGLYSNFDNCGVVRSPNCGACVAPMTCTSGTCSVAACVPEDRDTFCARYGKNCGSYTNLDNCGVMQTFNCASVCGKGDMCTNNVCVPTCKTCADIPNACGVYDNGCGAVLNCGTCTNGNVCSNLMGPGTCSCPAPNHTCGANCVANDANSCGATCKDCMAGVMNASSTVCSGGNACSYICNPGFLTCPGGIGCAVNYNTDNNNCGFCGNTCTVGKTCQAGSCK